MVVPMFKFFPQRLRHLLVEEAETFSEFEFQILQLANTLGEIESHSRDRYGMEGDVAACSWETELTDLVNDIDDQIDEFIIQMDQQRDSDRLTSIDCFRCKLQEIECQLAQSFVRMKEQENSTCVDKEAPHEVEDNLLASEFSTASQGEKEVGGKPFKMEDSQSAAPKNASNIGKDKDMPHDMEDCEKSPQEDSSITYFLQYSLLYCCNFPEDCWKWD